VVGGRAFVRNYTPTKHPVTDFKATVRMAAQQAYQGPPLDGPLELSMQCLLPRPKRLVWKRRPMPAVPHTSKPDVDNLAKAVFDALNGLLWQDDSQVYQASVSKWFVSGDSSPGVIVSIERAEA
jgi:Holliday junction resolvase RusA-like endonuclease